MVGLTSAQRYNKRMEKIWQEAKELGAFSEENLKIAREHENREWKKKQKVWKKMMNLK